MDDKKECPGCGSLDVIKSKVTPGQYSCTSCETIFSFDEVIRIDKMEEPTEKIIFDKMLKTKKSTEHVPIGHSKKTCDHCKIKYIPRVTTQKNCDAHTNQRNREIVDHVEVQKIIDSLHADAKTVYSKVGNYNQNFIIRKTILELQDAIEVEKEELKRLINLEENELSLNFDYINKNFDALILLQGILKEVEANDKKI